MRTDLEKLPLIPLNTVLFPYSEMMIHIFEDRYKELIRSCTQKGSTFGIVLIRSGPEVGGIADPYMVGTLARIVSIHYYDDGRMDVKLRGENRFRIRRLDDSSHSYLTGFVEQLQEETHENDPELDSVLMETSEAVQQLLVSILDTDGIDEHSFRLPDEPEAFSFVIANFLELENLKKQHLLEIMDTKERLFELLPIISEQLKNFAAHGPSLIRLTVSDVSEWISNN